MRFNRCRVQILLARQVHQAGPKDIWYRKLKPLQLAMMWDWKLRPKLLITFKRWWSKTTQHSLVMLEQLSMLWRMTKQSCIWLTLLSELKTMWNAWVSRPKTLTISSNLRYCCLSSNQGRRVTSTRILWSNLKSQLTWTSFKASSRTRK